MAAINGTFGGLDFVWRSNNPKLHKLQIRQMLKNIHGKIGSPINLSKQIFLTTLSVTISMLWGGSLNGEEAKLGLEIKDRLEEFVGLMGEPNLSDIFPILRPFDLQGIESKTNKHLSWFYRFLESMTEQRTKFGGEPKMVDSKDFP
ncbi:hypothetical protein Goari_009399 [Gossypium aridum]|uniref:Cytochrome P450 n=1 Tax=Gossypium aridum TaxID=34290 RepID=A0A7J8XWW6_GOSAI|nr:hypothetical protein [Gossypium aridum]